MHRNLLYVAYGWLLLGGVLHFSIEVVSQYLLIDGVDCGLHLATEKA